MAASYATFIVSFPELEPAGQPLIEAKIAEAELRVVPVGDTITNSAIRDLFVAYRAAHLLALSPYGMTAKLVSKDGSTTYGKQLEELNLTLAPSVMVL